MKLIEFRDDGLVISDEAFHVKVFKSLWNRDSSEAEKFFGYLYFMFHPGSDYNYITDLEEKEHTISEALGMSSNVFKFSSDPLYKQCEDVYKKMVVTTSSRTVDNNRKRLDKIDRFLDELELTDDNIAKYTRAISDVNKLAVDIANAEKEIFKHAEEQSAKVRGKAELTIGDRGL